MRCGAVRYGGSTVRAAQLIWAASCHCTNSPEPSSVGQNVTPYLTDRLIGSPWHPSRARTYILFLPRHRTPRLPPSPSFAPATRRLQLHNL